jgi:hypothetical protein
MKRCCRRFRPAGAALVISQRYLQSKIILGLALVALSLGNAVQARTCAFPIPSGSQPISITEGPDGNFWCALRNSSQVLRITPQGVITEFQTPTFSFPFDKNITVRPARNRARRTQAVAKFRDDTVRGYPSDLAPLLFGEPKIGSKPDRFISDMSFLGPSSATVR